MPDLTKRNRVRLPEPGETVTTPARGRRNLAVNKRLDELENRVNCLVDALPVTQWEVYRERMRRETK